MNIYYEAIRQFQYKGYTCRAWIELNDHIQAITSLIEFEFATYIDRNNCSIDELYCSEFLLTKDKRINAIEIKNNKGNGVVLYRDWP